MLRSVVIPLCGSDIFSHVFPRISIFPMMFAYFYAVTVRRIFFSKRDVIDIALNLNADSFRI